MIRQFLAQFKRKNILQTLILVTGSILLLYLFSWKLRLGIGRYFDVDEFAHLHWSYNFFRGMRPYTDFFDIFPPFFLFLMYPFWSILGNAISVLIEVRVFMFVLFVVLCGIIFHLARRKWGSVAALVGIVTFSFLPIPADKFLEIRPDLPAIVLSFLGIVFFVRGICRIRKLQDNSIGQYSPFFVSGLLYGSGMGFVPKTMFFVPGAILTFVYLWILLKEKRKILLQSLIWASIGLFIPFFIILVSTILFGDPVGAFLLMTKVSPTVQKALSEVFNHSFYMFPSLFFHQNQTYYGIGGYPLQYWVNFSIWIGISVWACVRMVGFLDEETVYERAINLLIITSFLFNFAAFTLYYPMKHAQYLMTLAPFVGYYFADFWNSLGGIFKRRRVPLFYPLVTIMFFILAYQCAIMINVPKIAWGNEQTYNDLRKLAASIPPDSYVFDLTGQTLVFKDPFYICCLPYGQYIDKLPMLPSLPESFEKTNTQYVVNNRLDALPPSDQAYIKSHYPRVILDGLLLTK